MRHRRWARSWLVLLLALLVGPVTAGLFDRFGGASQERILDADQAFQLTIGASDPVTLEARWIIAPGYYLYRDKFKLTLMDGGETTIARADIPAGEPKEDPYFGRQEVFHHEAVLVAHLRREPGGSQTVRVKADYQGCAEVGVCYPPLSQTVVVALPALSSLALTADQPVSTPPAPAGERVSERRATPVPALNAPEPEQDRLARLLGEQRFLAIPAFFGFGLLLAFTPACFRWCRFCPA